MEYTKEILEMVAIINQVLEKLGKRKLFQNPDFEIDDMSFEFYLKLHFNRLKPTVSIDFILSPFDIQIDIDRISEAFVWSKEQTKTDKNKLIDFIEMLFTNTIKIRQCGKNYTEVSFINDKGECKKNIKFINGLYLKIKCKTKEYLPIYKA